MHFLSRITALGVFLSVAGLCAFAQPGTSPEIVHLWPKGAPGFEERKDEKENITKNGAVTNIHNPSLTVYLPAKDQATGAGIVVIAGGGHTTLNVNGEGHAVAKWLADKGIAAFVLKHRLAREKGSPYKIETHALQDGQRALRLVRHNAKEWGVDPSRVGMMGFSAGGEVVAYASTQYDKGKEDASDPVERQGCRPDFQVLIYSGPLGIRDAKLTKETPPVFIAIGEKDGQAVLMANHFIALKKAGVSADLHIFADTPHAFGLGKGKNLSGTVQGWPIRLTEWMAGRGLLKRA